MLYRAGDTLLQMFYIYRELLFDKKVAKIEKRNGNLYINGRDFTDEEKIVVITEYEVITPFLTRCAQLGGQACSFGAFSVHRCYCVDAL